MITFLTNDRTVANRIKIIEAAHLRKRAKADDWLLALKIDWYRKCDRERQEAIDRVMASVSSAR